MTSDPSQQRDRLVEAFGRRFASGDVIFQDGDPAREIFLVQEGRVRVLKHVRDAERSLHILRPGDLLGEGALVVGSLRTATAVALSDVLALALGPETFADLVKGSSTLALRLLTQLARRLRESEEQLEGTLLRDEPSKIVNALLKLAQDDGRAPQSAQVTASPLELSARSGLDVDAVRRVVGRLREGQYVRIVDDRVVIDDLEALRRLYELLGRKEQLRG